MIVVRSPLRITLGGGGTDLPSYYEKHGGFTVAAAIDKYVYITIHETFVDDLIVKYSRLERVPSAEMIQHPIVREAMGLLRVDGRGLEISSMADIHAGTGLGSSGSFTTALLRALHAYKRDIVQPHELAEEACHVEIDLCERHVGKQDQYIAALGGITALTFGKDGRVQVSAVPVPSEVHYTLEENLLLFYTGYTRAASDILGTMPGSTEDLDEIKEIGTHVNFALMSGDLDCFARLLNQQWEIKRRRPNTSNDDIDRCYQFGIKNGALGGKLVGAGGGGFLMFYAEDKRKLRSAMGDAGLRELRFRFDFEGTRVVAS